MVKHPHAMVVDTVLGNGFCFTLALGLGLCAGLEGAEADGLESSSTASLKNRLRRVHIPHQHEIQIMYQ